MVLKVSILPCNRCPKYFYTNDLSAVVQLSPVRNREVTFFRQVISIILSLLNQELVFVFFCFVSLE